MRLRYYNYHLRQLIRDLVLLSGNPFDLANFSLQHQTLRNLAPFDNLVHIGANTGQEMAMYRFFKFTNVVFIEPDVRAFRFLKLRWLVYGRKGKVIRSLIDEASGKTVNFYLLSQSGASSMFLPTGILSINKEMKIRGTTQLITQSADDALKENGIDITGSNNCLVIDVQGAELQVLLGFANLLIFKVIMLEIAPNLYAIKNNYKAIDQMLLGLGYTKVFGPIREKWDDIIYVNQNIT
jgi:FkbM family methyltransferase